MDRRHFLKQAGLFSAAAGLTGFAAPSLALPTEYHPERSLRLYNIHTSEYLTTTFFADGQYLHDEVQELDFLLRDHRANQAAAIAHELYEKMYYLQQLFDSHEPLYIISGYRAPKTNSNLRNVSEGVAENSWHMQGKAVDIRIPGVSHRDLHKAALRMRAGGVGYYPTSGFIHLDTGRVRSWKA